MRDPDWIPEQDVNNNNQNLIERNNLETDESRDNQSDAERVLGEDRNNGIDENPFFHYLSTIDTFSSLTCYRSCHIL
jgi:hypothetical protein